MLDTLSVNDDEVFAICQRHFSDVGLPLRPAKGTPLKLSYIWKHVQKLTKRFSEWDFSAEEIDAYIRIVAYKISRLPPRQQSLQNAVRADMLDFCYDELQRQAESVDELQIEFQQVHAWFKSTCGNDHDTQLTHLLRRHRPGALPNIIVYFQQGQLSKAYIAFSQVCREALNVIAIHNPTERQFCANDAALHYITHYKFKPQASSIKKILGA